MYGEQYFVNLLWLWLGVKFVHCILSIYCECLDCVLPHIPWAHQLNPVWFPNTRLEYMCMWILGKVWESTTCLTSVCLRMNTSVQSTDTLVWILKLTNQTDSHGNVRLQTSILPQGECILQQHEIISGITSCHKIPLISFFKTHFQVQCSDSTMAHRSHAPGPALAGGEGAAASLRLSQETTFLGGTVEFSIKIPGTCPPSVCSGCSGLSGPWAHVSEFHPLTVHIYTITQDITIT